MDRQFSVFEVLQTAWEITKKNFLVIIGYSVVAFLTLAIVQFVSIYLISSDNWIISFATLFSVLVINSIATLGFYKLTFHLIDDESDDIEVKSIIPSWKNISSFINLTLLFGVIVTSFNIGYAKLKELNSFEKLVNAIENSPLAIEFLAAALLFIFFVVAMRFMFFPCFIVDDNSGSFESLRQSRQLTQDNLLKIITVLFVVVGFIVLGFLAFGIGIIITYPFTNIILVVTYRKLVNSYIETHPAKDTEEKSTEA